MAGNEGDASKVRETLRKALEAIVIGDAADFCASLTPGAKRKLLRLFAKRPRQGGQMDCISLLSPVMPFVAPDRRSFFLRQAKILNKASVRIRGRIAFVKLRGATHEIRLAKLGGKWLIIEGTVISSTNRLSN